MTLPAPHLQAMVLADRVYTDSETNKRIIAGTFNAVQSQRFPFVYSQGCWIYLALRDMVDSSTVELTFLHMRDQHEIWKLTIEEITSPGRLATIEIQIPLPPMPFPVPGDYEIVLDGNGRRLGGCKIQASEISSSAEASQ